MSKDKLEAILSLATAALGLSGVAQGALITELVRQSAAAFQEFHGKPVDPNLIPKFERIT